MVVQSTMDVAEMELISGGVNGEDVIFYIVRDAVSHVPNERERENIC